MLEGSGGGKQKTSEDQIMQDYKGGFESSGGAAGSPTAGLGGKVYMGPTPRTTPGVGRDSVLTGAYGPENMARLPSYMSKSEANSFIDNLSGKQLADLQAKMIYGGLIKENDGLLEMRNVWKRLVDASYGLTQAGQKISPMDVLDSYLNKGPLGGKGGLGALAAGGASVWQTQYRGGRKFLVNSQTGEVKYEGPRFETTYQKSIDLTDPTTAKAIATSVFQQLMHRDPGAGELAGYGNALRSAEEQSPVVSQQTTEYDMNTGEPIGTTTQTTGGLSADARQYMAEQRIKKTKEYASTQAATTYMNALESAIFNNPFGSI